MSEAIGPETEAGKWLVKLLRAVPRGKTMTREQQATADVVERTLRLVEEQAARDAIEKLRRDQG